MTLMNHFRSLLDRPLKADALLIGITEWWDDYHDKFVEGHKVTRRRVVAETEEFYELEYGFSNDGKLINKNDTAIKEVLY